MKICSVCKIEKDESEYWPDRRRKNGLMARCKECNKVQARKYRLSTPNYEKDKYQKYKTETRERHLKRKYGISLENYNDMLKEQNNKCAICGDDESYQFKSVFHVDHSHETGEVRGLLCRGCNHMLGVVRDDPQILQNAIKYLSSRKSRQK